MSIPNLEANIIYAIHMRSPSSSGGKDWVGSVTSTGEIHTLWGKSFDHGDNLDNRRNLNKIPRTGAIEKSDLDMVAGLIGRRLANFGRTLPVEPEPEAEQEVEEQEAEFIVVAIPQQQAVEVKQYR